MGSFPETYNDPNKRRLYSTKARKTFRSSFWAKVGERKREREQKRGMKGEVEGKRGNASPQTPRCYETPHDISLFPLFFVPLFHAILVTRSKTLVTQATGFHVSPLAISCRVFSRPRVFSSRAIKHLIVTALFAIALAGIGSRRILREKEDSHPTPRS